MKILSRSNLYLSGLAVMAGALAYINYAPELGRKPIDVMSETAMVSVASPTSSASPTSAPFPTPYPTPAILGFGGFCVEPGERESAVIEQDRTLSHYAADSLRSGENLRERISSIATISRIKNPDLIRAGDKLLIRNNGIAPKIIVPDSVDLHAGQSLILTPGLEGLVCGSQIQLSFLPFGAKFEKGTFYWTPAKFQGSYSVLFSAKDADVYVQKRANVNVKIEEAEFFVDGKPFTLLPSSILTTDKRTGYAVNLSFLTDDPFIKAVSRDKGYPEKGFEYIHRIYGFSDFAGKTYIDPDFLKAADYIRRHIMTEGNPNDLKPFYFGKGGSMPFPLLVEKVKL